MEPIIKKVDICDEVVSISSKRIRTAFIYAVFALEEQIGNLWGENKRDDEPLTDEEQKMYDLFMNWRKTIMDYGHSQMRICEKEIKRAYNTLIKDGK